MANKQIIIIAVILTLAAAGLFLFFGITGNSITGASIHPSINSEYFKIDNFGSEEIESQNDDQNIEIIKSRGGK